MRYIIPDLPSADELMPFLRRIDEARWYSNFGPLVQEFETNFAGAIAATHRAPLGLSSMVTLASCYHALAIGLKFLGVCPGDKVLMPAFTFTGCPLAAAHVGAETIFADVDDNSWTLTPTIARAVAAKTKLAAVMPVAIYGVPVPADAWDVFTEDTGIPVVIDAAAAIESQLYPRRGLVAHSLHALKPFGIGEGGLLVGSDTALIQAVRQYSNFGMRDRIALMDGENAKLSEYHAAVALAQLGRWPQIKKRRRTVYDFYKAAWEELAPAADLFSGLDRAIISCLMLRLHNASAEDIVEALNGKGVAAHRTYLPPLYRHAQYTGCAVASAEGVVRWDADLAAKAAMMSNSEALNDSVIGLPFHSFMSEDDVYNCVTQLSALADLNDVNNMERKKTGIKVG